MTKSAKSSPAGDSAAVGRHGRTRPSGSGAAAVLCGFARALAGAADTETLLGELSRSLRGALPVDRVDVALADRRTHSFRVQRGPGGDASPPPDAVPEDHPCVDCLRRVAAPLRCDAPAAASASDGRACAELFARYGWQVCVPVSAARQLLGFVGLSGKSSLSDSELEIAQALCVQAGLALHCARMQGELHRSRDVIRRADRLSALGTLAAGIAHEVRNPLVSIQTFFQLLPTRMDDEEFRTSFLEMTASEVQRITSLITELLSYARSPTAALEDVDLDEVVGGVITLLAPEAKKQQLCLEQSPSAGSPAVRADADRLKQVVINVVLNAIQATKPGGHVELRTCTAYDEERTLGRVEVRDSGAGIPPERLEHIFDPFYTTKDGGTGLGLAIAHEIVAEHGGRLSVDSVPGQGTVFYIDLPLVDTTRAGS